MKNLIVDKSNSTLGVVLNAEEGVLRFYGESRPKDVTNFFKPIVEWMGDYSDYLLLSNQSFEEKIPITCEFKFEYFNSSSAKFIMDILYELKQIKSIGKVQLSIIWYYDDQDHDLLDAGKEFEELTGVSFNYIITQY